MDLTASMTDHIQHLRDQHERLGRLIEKLELPDTGPVTQPAKQMWESYVGHCLEDLRDVNNALEGWAKF